jgi:transcriptional regulator with XRE-family HTH domain
MLEKQQAKERIRKLDSEIGLAVHYARMTAGFTQEDLANLLGCSFQQVQKYEKGDNRISSGKLSEIAKLLKTPINYFFDASVDEDLIKNTKDNDIMSIANDYSKIKNPKMRKQIRGLIRVAANIDTSDEE